MNFAALSAKGFSVVLVYAMGWAVSSTAEDSLMVCG